MTDNSHNPDAIFHFLISTYQATEPNLYMQVMQYHTKQNFGVNTTSREITEKKFFATF
jgi:hypothetical protein